MGCKHIVLPSFKQDDEDDDDDHDNNDEDENDDDGESSLVVAMMKMTTMMIITFFLRPRLDICHKHHKQRLCKIIITRVKFYFVNVFLEHGCVYHFDFW